MRAHMNIKRHADWMRVSASKMGRYESVLTTCVELKLVYSFQCGLEDIDYLVQHLVDHLLSQ